MLPGAAAAESAEAPATAAPAAGATGTDDTAVGDPELESADASAALNDGTPGGARGAGRAGLGTSTGVTTGGRGANIRGGLRSSRPDIGPAPRVLRSRAPSSPAGYPQGSYTS